MSAGSHGSTWEVAVSLRVNDEPLSTEVPTSEMLIDSIRDRCGLEGTKLGCDQAVCGACTVRVDGVPTASCSTFTWQVDGADVRTIEGLRASDELSAEQQAFAETSAFQCGYCTPGIIMSSAALLDEIPEPSEAQIVEWLGANICRCTGYRMIVEAVRRAAELRR